MAADDFFSRWGKPGTVVREDGAGPSIALPAPGLPVQPPARSDGTRSEADAHVDPRTLTGEDAARLTADADFTPFMAKGVDESVKRLALKKLFTDPHYNIMDGLDIYIGDYNTFVPMSAAMVASLNHAKALLDPIGHLLQPMMALIDPEKPDVQDQPGIAIQAALETGLLENALPPAGVPALVSTVESVAAVPADPMLVTDTMARAAQTEHSPLTDDSDQLDPARPVQHMITSREK